jgi:hypothetical protein
VTHSTFGDPHPHQAWYAGCPDKDRLARLALENGVDPANVHDAPELTAGAVLPLLRPGTEDHAWLSDLLRRL